MTTQITRAAVETRLATDDDASTIANLCAACGYNGLDDADWSRVHPYWIVAELGGLIVGVVQIAVSLPVGRFENLAIEPEMSKRDRAIIFRALARQAEVVLGRAGCSLASGMISDEMADFTRLMLGRGAVASFHGTTILMQKDWFNGR